MSYHKNVNNLIQDKEVLLNSLIESFNIEFKKWVEVSYKYYSSVFMNKEGKLMYDGYLRDNLEEVVKFQAHLLTEIIKRVEECRKDLDNESNISV